LEEGTKQSGWLVTPATLVNGKGNVVRCCLKVEPTLAKTRIEKPEHRAMISGLKAPEIGKMMGVGYSTVSQGRKIFSTLEIIFCAFLAENYFVKVLIQFICVKESLKEDRVMVSKVEKKLSIEDPIDIDQQRTSFYKRTSMKIVSPKYILIPLLSHGRILLSWMLFH
jgi:hypothetical protein